MKKVLILLPDIWSMGKGKGMPSIDKFLREVTKRNECIIFTTDQNDIKNDYNDALVFQFNTIGNNVSNRYVRYFISRVNFILINLKYFFYALKMKFRPDVIYSASSVPSIASCVLSKIFNAKLISRIYGTFLYEKINSKLDKFKKYEECFSFLIDADKYIITNDGTKGNIVAEHFGIDKNKIEFLVNGVELNKSIICSPDFLKDRYGIPHDHLVAICVSRLSSWKRVDRIVSAFNKLVDAKISLIVFGDGDLSNSLQSQSRSDNVHFAGSVSSYEVHEAMVNSDIFISMYDYSNVGNPLLEALSYGMCIITLDTGGTRDFIDGKNGIIIDDKSELDIVNSLEREIRNLLDNHSLIIELSSHARMFANDNIKPWDFRINYEVEVLEALVTHDK